MFHDVIQRSREFHATGFAAATGMHLGLDDPEPAPELFRSRARFLRGGGHLPSRHRNSELSEEGLGLVLVKIQRESLD